jgi:hypothetical protein
MLGVVSNINEMLQDVQGKKSMSIKRQILRSFGALVIHIGPAINNVAPQVMQCDPVHGRLTECTFADHGHLSDNARHL